MFAWLRRLFNPAPLSTDPSSPTPSETEKAALDSEQENKQESKPTADIESVSHGLTQNDASNESEDFGLVAFDENMLERARAQWQFGDWQSLAKISREMLLHHPDRAKLAILVAAAHGQVGQLDKLQQFVQFAKAWGCSRKLISQVLISGVQNSLGRAALVSNQHDRARIYFEQSVQTAMPGTDIRLFSNARQQYQEEIIQVLSDKQIELDPKFARNDYRAKDPA